MGFSAYSSAKSPVKHWVERLMEDLSESLECLLTERSMDWLAEMREQRLAHLVHPLTEKLTTRTEVETQMDR